MEVLSMMYRREENDVAFLRLEERVDKLHNILGNHEECSFAIKKYADRLHHSGHEDESAPFYEKAYNMNEALANETGVAYRSTILILKEWGQSYLKSNPTLAILRLKEADMLIKQNCMLKHSWAKRIDRYLSKARESLARRAWDPKESGRGPGTGFVRVSNCNDARLDAQTRSRDRKSNH
jgi:hypothetical protein